MKEVGNNGRIIFLRYAIEAEKARLETLHKRSIKAKLAKRKIERLTAELNDLTNAGAVETR